MAEVRCTIRVINSEGIAVAGVYVFVEKSSVPFPEIGLITSEDGILTLPMPPGSYRMGARSVDGEHGMAEFTIENENEKEIVITLASMQE